MQSTTENIMNKRDKNMTKIIICIMLTATYPFYSTMHFSVWLCTRIRSHNKHSSYTAERTYFQTELHVYRATTVALNRPKFKRESVFSELSFRRCFPLCANMARKIKTNDHSYQRMCSFGKTALSFFRKERVQSDTK